jgi:hypothetical protein
MDTLTGTHTDQNIVHDWRFIEFVMRTWTDPDLAEQYRSDPIETLASYGLCASAAAAANAGAGAGVTTVTVDDLDHPAPLTAAFTLCG